MGLFHAIIAYVEKIKLAYFAGLMDGEGNIGIYPQGKSKRLRPCVKLNMTDKETVVAVAEFFGGNVSSKKVANGNKPQWHWSVTYKKASKIIRLLRPYLITKAAAADYVLSLYKS